MELCNILPFLFAECQTKVSPRTAVPGGDNEDSRDLANKGIECPARTLLRQFRLDKVTRGLIGRERSSVWTTLKSTIWGGNWQSLRGGTVELHLAKTLIGPAKIYKCTHYCNSITRWRTAATRPPTSTSAVPYPSGVTARPRPRWTTRTPTTQTPAATTAMPRNWPSRKVFSNRNGNANSKTYTNALLGG